MSSRFCAYPRLLTTEPSAAASIVSCEVAVERYRAFIIDDASTL
jgi:hypothetical protein